MILMDTCAIVWDALEPEKLTSKALETIDNGYKHNELVISDISIWEISMLIKKGRIEVATTTANFLNLFIQYRNITILSISPEVAELSVNFDSQINKDPADRIIAATSIIHNAQLVTADQNLRKSTILNTVW